MDGLPLRPPRRPLRLPRGFTLVEIIIALTVLASLVAMVYPSLGSNQQRANDNIAIGVANQLAANFQHFEAQNGAYPNNCFWGWSTIINSVLGSGNAELPSTPPPVFTNSDWSNAPGNIAAGGSHACAGSATITQYGGFVIIFSALGGTGTWYCRDGNGLANIGIEGNWVTQCL